MTKVRNISLRARWLGEWLRDARNKAGYKLTDAGEYLQMDFTTLGRFERGTHRIRRSYVKDLIDFYGISDERTREALLKLNEDSWRRDWWEGDTSDLDVAFIDYTWLEARSSSISIFEPMLLPGLLQTREYTDAVMAHGTGPEAEPEQRERLAELRVARQRILDGPEPTRLSAVIEEAPLRRPVGSKKVRAAQLRHLIEVGRQEHIDIKVLPMSVGWHVGVAGPFRLFEMPDPYPDVAYIEHLVGRTFLEDEAKVDQYRDAYDWLYRCALNPRETVSHIQKVLKELE